MEFVLEISISTVVSSFDGSPQNIRFFEAKGSRRPLVVALHGWKDNHLDPSAEFYIQQCRERDWHCIVPEFRGINNNPQACGSDEALRDVLDSVEWAQDTFNMDMRRIFLIGLGGGGYMALLLASRSPSAWTAVSVWSPVTDLSKWHGQLLARELPFSEDLEKICGGFPGISSSIDHEYKKRSPVHSLWRGHIIPLDINSGIYDGHSTTRYGKGPVPAGQAILAYNSIVKGSGKKSALIPRSIIETIEREGRIPEEYSVGIPNDQSYLRKILMRTESGLTRLTVFKGGHEILYSAAFSWFEKY